MSWLRFLLGFCLLARTEYVYYQQSSQQRLTYFSRARPLSYSCSSTMQLWAGMSLHLRSCLRLTVFLAHGNDPLGLPSRSQPSRNALSRTWIGTLMLTLRIKRSFLIAIRLLSSAQGLLSLLRLRLSALLLGRASLRRRDLSLLLRVRTTSCSGPVS